MASNIVYRFYFTTNEIVDHDYDYGAVMGEVRNDLGAFFDYKTGLEYYEHLYPNRTIQCESIRIMDAEE